MASMLIDAIPQVFPVADMRIVPPEQFRAVRPEIFRTLAESQLRNVWRDCKRADICVKAGGLCASTQTSSLTVLEKT